MFNWRKIEKEDYGLLCSWWEDWKWTPPTIGMLTNQGIMVFDGDSGIPLYSTFLYDGGTEIAWMEYTISNKNAPINLKRGALEYMVDVISTIAKYKGIKTLFTATNMPSFVQGLKKSGYEIGDENITIMVKKL